MKKIIAIALAALFLFSQVVFAETIVNGVSQSEGGGGTPGGSDTQVQFNDGGSAFGGDAGFVYNKTTNKATIGGVTTSDLNGVITVDGVVYAKTSTGIQAAISALAGSVGTVHLTNGTYDITASVTLPDNVTLEGEGYETYLKAHAGLNAPILTEAGAGAGNTNITIRNLRCDGDKANQTVAFSTIDMENVTYCSFIDLWVTGALRTGTFPTVSSDGEGLVLRDSSYNRVIGGFYYDNEYDGIKLRASDYNEITGCVMTNNGRAGVQISKNSTATTSSDYNTITNIVVYHATGTPSVSSPVTSGIYIHDGNNNAISGISVYGVRQGIGIYCDNATAGASGNVIAGSTFAIRYVDRAGFDMEDGSVASGRNTFTGNKVTGISGANGKYVRVERGFANMFNGNYFDRGAGTGTWTYTIDANSNDNKFIQNSYNNLSITDSGTRDVFYSVDASGNLDLSGHVIGNGGMSLKNGATSSGYLDIFEDSDNGTNYTRLQVPALAANLTLTLPPDAGASGKVLKTDGAGVLTWETDATGLGGDQLVDIVTTAPLTVNGGANVNDALPGADADITFALTQNLPGINKHIRFTIVDPKTAYGKDHEICIVPKLDAAITVTNIEVTCDADPATEPRGDLKYADSFIGLANAVVINDFDTTAGARSDNSITSGGVASGKAIYISFDAEPDAAITQMSFDITYDYD